MNEQGAVAGKSETKDGTVKAFYWDAVWGMVDIGLGKALGINNAGQVVGNIHHHNDDAFIWDAQKGLAFLNKGDFLFATANGIDHSGKVVGYARKFNDIEGTRAILWDSSAHTLEILDTLDGPGYAFGINCLGEVVGNAGNPSRAFIWNRTEGMKDLGTLNGEGWRYYAVDINDNGHVAGYARTVSDEYHGFTWEPGVGMKRLSGDGESLALGINGHGHVVGAQGTIIGLSGKAYLWKGDERIDLNQTIPLDSGWDLREARGITDGGLICGAGLINGEMHAYLLTPVPSVKADIKANGSDSAVTVSPGEMVTITISLDPGDQTGLNADWWVAVRVSGPSGKWYSYVHPTGWQPGIHLCSQTPLFSLSAFEVFRSSLPLGNYVFHFAVDNNADGLADATFRDAVCVNVE